MLSQFKKATSAKISSKTNILKRFKSAQCETIGNTYDKFINADNKKQQRKYMLQLIDLCYNHLNNQMELAELLHLPFLAGPITLHSFPTVLVEQNQVIHQQGEYQQTQLQFLFNFLKNVKEYYYCWIIYFNQDLKILNLKLLKKEQIKDHQDMFNPIINLIGIFINRTHSKPNAANHCLEDYYSITAPIQKAGLVSEAASTVNNSTGATWKMMMMEKVNEEEEDRKNKKVKFRSVSPKMRFQSQNKGGKGYSIKNDSFKSKKVSDKSYSINCSKEKSKSQILLNRCKSNNIKEIILQPLKNGPKYLQQKPKGATFKTKLKKQGKVNKIESIYFRKQQKRALQM